jgi:peroxiredoxin
MTPEQVSLHPRPSAQGDGAEAGTQDEAVATPKTGDANRSTPLSAGTKAPNFTLQSTSDQQVSLADFRGRPVILAFYPADWSPVCGDQLALYNEVLGEFQRYGAALLGISVDGAWCHAAFASQRHFHFPLLADFEPKGAVARSYGVYATKAGLSNRALFVIDKAGAVRWSHVSPMSVNPGADGILAALESMAADEGEKRSDSRADTPPRATQRAHTGVPPGEERV